MKEIYNVHKLDLKQVALSFGFTVPPKVELRINTKMGAIKRRGGGGGFGEGYKEAAGGGGAFSTGKNLRKKERTTSGIATNLAQVIHMDRKQAATSVNSTARLQCFSLSCRQP